MRNKFIYFVVLIHFFSGFSQKAVSKKEKLNIVYIVVDDLNRWIGALGGQAKTPNIDKFAAESMLFTNAQCVVPACNPSRVAVMTGLRPETTGQYVNEGNFREKPGNENRLTMAQYLKNNGYETVAVGKIFHHPRGIAKEPDPFSDPISWDIQNINSVGTSGHQLYLDKNKQAAWLEGAMAHQGKSSSGGGYMSKSGVWGITPEKKEQTSDWKNAVYAANYLKEKHNKPFFLGCGIFRPHSPQIAPKEFFDLYPLDSIKMDVLPEDDMIDVPEHIRSNFSTEFVGHLKSKNQLKNAVQGYLASVSFADACIGELLTGIENGPNKKNTIVVLWTDHGWQLGHKDRWEKFSLWDMATNTPLIIKHPKKKNIKNKISQPVSLLDLYPTMLDFIGLEKPKDLQGVSLNPFFKDSNHIRKEPAVITFEEGNVSVRKGDWNFIQYKNRTEELYNHKTDPMEYNNLANKPENSEILIELRIQAELIKKKK